MLAQNLLYLSSQRENIPYKEWGALAATLIDCYNPKNRTADFQRAANLIKKLDEIFRNCNLPTIGSENSEEAFKDFINYVFQDPNKSRELFAA